MEDEWEEQLGNMEMSEGTFTVAANQQSCEDREQALLEECLGNSIKVSLLSSQKWNVVSQTTTHNAADHDIVICLPLQDRDCISSLFGTNPSTQEYLALIRYSGKCLVCLLNWSDNLEG